MPTRRNRSKSEEWDDRKKQKSCERQRKCRAKKLSLEKEFIKQKDRNRKQKARYTSIAKTAELRKRERQQKREYRRSSNRQSKSKAKDRDRKKLYRYASLTNITKIQEREKQRKREYRLSSKNRSISKAKDRDRKQQYRYASLSNKTKIQEREKQRKRKYRLSSKNRSISKAKDRNRKQQYRYATLTNTTKIREIEKQRKRKYRLSSKKRSISKAKDRDRKKQYRYASQTNTKQIRDKEKQRKRAYRRSSKKRSISKAKDRERKKLYRYASLTNTTTIQEKERQQKRKMSKTSSFRAKDCEKKRKARYSSPTITAVLRAKEKQRKHVIRKCKVPLSSEKLAKRKCKGLIRYWAHNKRKLWKQEAHLRFASTFAVTTPESIYPCLIVDSNIQMFSEEALNSPNYLGPMNAVCQFCNAKHFKQETPKDKKFSKCCHKGKVALNPFKPPPNYILQLLDGTDTNSKYFLANIRRFNNMFAMASMGARIQSLGPGPYCFKIQGAIYHRTSNLHPDDNNIPRYAQLYILDPHEASEHRVNEMRNIGQKNNNDAINRLILTRVYNLLRTFNPFAKTYKTMRDLEVQEKARSEEMGLDPNPIIIDFLQHPNSDLRRYNAPVSTEVAVVFQTEQDGEPPQNRDLRVYPRGHELHQISYMNSFLDPMLYPLFHFFGENGWHDDIKQLDPTGNFRPVTTNKRVTQLQFYNYKIQIRDGEFNPLLRGGRLFQQYVVDVYVRTEANRLKFIRENQNQLLIESYSGLMDHVNNREHNLIPEVGRMVILPSSFTGGPRYMQQNYQDAMSVVAKSGRPDLFITMTCNPGWLEIRENILPGQVATDRPDIVVIVFKIKLEELLREIQVKEIFGKVEALMYTVEFQKRGLPHAHILIILKRECKILTTENIDKIVTAELPNKETHPILYELVTSHMIHSPCGNANGNPNSPCIDANMCTKRFPKDFRTETEQNIDGYPQYRRPDNGRHYLARKKVGTGSVRVDNRWVVPYNPYLLYKFQSHINVEVCASVKSVKYIYKYIYKGYDAARINVKERNQDERSADEIHNYINCRYVSPPEALWRLNEYILHDRTHVIIRLAVHLKNRQGITFKKGQEREALQRHRTTLTAWFDLNSENSEAHQYRYVDIPYHFVFDKSQKKWKSRSVGRKIIPRMYTVSPLETERYYLRLLLLHVRGCKEHEDIRRVDGILHETFRAAAQARNLLDDDTELERSLNEASSHRMPRELRLMFSMLLIFASPSNPLELWNKFKVPLSEDYMQEYNDDVSYDNSLNDINTNLLTHGRKNSDFNLRMPSLNTVIATESYDLIAERILAETNINSFNNRQLYAFNRIIDAVESNELQPKCFFLNAIAGSGKTFLFETLAHRLRSVNIPPVVVASTGIAALLLQGGRTAHSVFKIPVPTVENSTSSIALNSPEAATLKKCKLILWDEATMVTGHVLNVVDRLLRFVKGNEIPFGATTIVLAGDYRQTLPVVRRGDRCRIIQATLKRSFLWHHFTTLHLLENVRVNTSEIEFSNYLLSVGNGTAETFPSLGDDIVMLPQECISTGNIVDEIFGDLAQPLDPHVLAKKVILCPKNEETIEINNSVLLRLPGESRNYMSADSAHTDIGDLDTTLYSTEFLNSLTPSGMPPHVLTLKVGSIVLLLRNLAIKAGLCNGTRLIVRSLLENFIIAEVITGTFHGKKVMIPRIILDPSDIGLPFRLRRRQFPLRLGFALTINKSQGQTFEQVGVYLKEPVFAHGQLYVAFSRVTSKEGLRIKIENTPQQGKLKRRSPHTYTRNIVYHEILS